MLPKLNNSECLIADITHDWLNLHVNCQQNSYILWYACVCELCMLMHVVMRDTCADTCVIVIFKCVYLCINAVYILREQQDVTHSHQSCHSAVDRRRVSTVVAQRQSILHGMDGL